MMRVVFFGTPQFAAIILEFLIQQPIEIVAVISRPDKPKGRSGKPLPTAVKCVAHHYGLPLYQPKKVSDAEYAQLLKSLDPDLFIVAAYAEILKENILEIPRFGCLNVHGSILPKYRGAAPVQRALMAGESETGVSIIKMVPEMDAGDVYSIVKIPIPEEMNAQELFNEMAHVGANALWDVMQKIVKKEIQAVPQDHTQATFTKKVTSEEGKIEWSKSAKEIHNQIRGLTPNPGAWCYVNIRGEKKRLNIKKASPLSEYSGLPGECIMLPTRLIVLCGHDALELLEVQLEGKKTLPACDFLRGLQKGNLIF